MSQSKMGDNFITFATKDQVTFSCLNHYGTLTRGLINAFTHQRGVDLDLNWGGRSIKAHSLIVDLFLNPEKQCQAINLTTNPNTTTTSTSTDPITTVQTSQADNAEKTADPVENRDLDSMIEFMYNGQVTVPRDRLDGLLDVAKFFDFKMLVNAVTKFSQATLAFKNSPKEKLPTQKADKKPVRRKKNPRPLRNARVGRRRALLASKAKLASEEADDHDPGNDEEEEAEKCEESDSNVTSSVEKTGANGEKPSKWIKCLKCRRSFLTQKKLNRHLANHPNFKCAICGFETLKYYSYSHHMFSRHQLNSKGETFEGNKCDQCSSSFERKSHLRYHILHKHSGVKPFHCDQCPFRTGRHTELSRHVRQAHMDMKPHLCWVCPFRTVTNSKLVAHMRKHTGEKPFQCNICSQKFVQSSSYKYHMKRHVEKEGTHVCHICGKAFTRSYSLKIHLKNVHQSDDAAALRGLPAPDNLPVRHRISDICRIPAPANVHQQDPRYFFHQNSVQNANDHWGLTHL